VFGYSLTFVQIVDMAEFLLLLGINVIAIARPAILAH